MGMPSKYILPINPTGILNTNYEGSVFTYTVGETVIFGGLCYFSGTAFMLLDTTQVRSMVSMSLENKSSGQSCKFLQKGFVRNDSWSWTPGESLWVGAVPGAITNIKPSGESITQYIGYALTSTLIYFTPASASDGVVTEKYILSRGENLCTNGLGLMLEGYNFSGFFYDQIETHGGAGSFRQNLNRGTRQSDEYLPVDPEKYYRLVGWGKSGDVDGGNFNPANIQYFGLQLFDIDKNPIQPQHSAKYPGSTDTTLALPLNNGDITITLTSAVGWYNSTIGFYSSIAWYGYTNSFGYTYLDYTYTRNVLFNNAWPAGGISGNVITLTVPWAGGNLPAGTAVRNAYAGDTFKYTALFAGTVPNEWTRYEGSIGNYPAASGETNDTFRRGTAYVKLTFLINYHNIADNNIRWSDLWFSETSARNLELASPTSPGVIGLSNQSLGAGDKYFSANVGVGTTTITGARVDSRSISTPQYKGSYDPSNYFTLESQSTGAMKITTTNPKFQVNDRLIIAPAKTVVDGVATGIFEVALPAGAMTGGRADYTCSATNGTDYQSHTGTVSWAAVNKAGVITTDVATSTGGSGIEVTAQSTGTLADVWTCVAGVGKVTLYQNANSNLAGTILIVTTFTVTNNLANSVTLL